MDKQLLNDATSSDDSPTPGYMLNEIAKATVANYAACTDLIQFLTSRIKKNNHNIKYKCLVIIKHVCRTGRSDFKRDMSRNLDPIKECLQYKGPPDPLRGDEIYRRVRENAQEALEAIFDSQQPVTTSAIANKIQGFSGGDAVTNSDGASKTSIGSYLSYGNSGSSNDSSYIGQPGSDGNFSFQHNNSRSAYSNSNTNLQNKTYSTNSSSGMVGIGNPNFKDAREEKSWLRRVSELADEASSTIANMSVSKGPTTTTFQDQMRDNSNVEYQYRSNRGNFDESRPAYSDAPAASKVVPDLPVNSSGFGRAGSAAIDGEYERSLVAALCEPGGMKAIPPEDKLNSFLLAASTLSCELIGNSLIDFLNEDAWQTRVKALIVIDNLVKAPGCNLHTSWWIEHGDILRNMLQDGKAAVRTQATKVVKLLKLGDVSETTYQSPPKTSASVPHNYTSQNDSLINFLDDSEKADTKSVPTQSGELFSGMTLEQKPTVNNTTEVKFHSNASINDNSDVFDMINSAATQQNVQHHVSQPPISNEPLSLFDMLNGSGPGPAQAPPASEPRVAYQKEISGGGLLDLEPIIITPSHPSNSAPFNLAEFDPLQGNAPSSNTNNNSFNLRNSNPAGANPNANSLNLSVPLPPQMQQSYLRQQQQINYNYQQPAYSMPPPVQQNKAPSGPHYVPYQPNAMGSPSKTNRKIIPDTNSYGHGGGSDSGFGFMGEKKKSADESFSFVTEAMKSSVKK